MPRLYDSEYQSLSQELNKKLTDFRNSDVGKLTLLSPLFPYLIVSENGGNIMRHLDGLLAQSNDLIKQMEIEVRTQDPATKKVLNEKLQQYKKSLSSFRTDYERAKADADRANLIDSRSGSDRERFLKTNDKFVFPSSLSSLSHSHAAVSVAESIVKTKQSETQQGLSLKLKMWRWKLLPN
jgi:hypothetical protein